LSHSKDPGGPDSPEPCIDSNSIAETNHNIAEKLQELQSYFESEPTGWRSQRADARAAEPSYEELFRPFLQDRTRMDQDGRSNFVVKEHEPFIYTRLSRPLPYRVSGLRNVTAGEEGALTLDTHGAVLPRSPVELVRVLFYGIAVAAPREWVGNESGVWAARFRLVDPGLYRVYVESVYRPNGTYHQYRAIEGSPFTLLVRPPGSDGQSDEQVWFLSPLGEKGCAAARGEGVCCQQSRSCKWCRITHYHCQAVDGAGRCGARGNCQCVEMLQLEE
jgi:hypothetical protein